MSAEDGTGRGGLQVPAGSSALSTEIFRDPPECAEQRVRRLGPHFQAELARTREVDERGHEGDGIRGVEGSRKVGAVFREVDARAGREVGAKSRVSSAVSRA